MVRSRLAQSFALDRLWRETMGLPEGDTKEGALRALVEVLEMTRTRYAVIGGVAVQIYSREPRTTLDVDVAVARFDQVPRDALLKAGFVYEGRHEHSDNWRAPGAGAKKDRTAIQFSSEDVGIEDAVARAKVVDAGGYRFRLAAPADLLVLKLAAAEESTRRASKRRVDLLDIINLGEEHPAAARAVPMLRQRVERLTAKLLTIGKSRGPER
jgi:hypothetical protein